MSVRGGAAGTESRQEAERGGELSLAAYKEEKGTGPRVLAAQQQQVDRQAPICPALQSDLPEEDLLGGRPLVPAPRMGTMSRAALVLACLTVASVASDGGGWAWSQHLDEGLGPAVLDGSSPAQGTPQLAVLSWACGGAGCWSL